jgi:hypothetical protein
VDVQEAGGGSAGEPADAVVADGDLVHPDDGPQRRCVEDGADAGADDRARELVDVDLGARGDGRQVVVLEEGLARAAGLGGGERRERGDGEAGESATDHGVLLGRGRDGLHSTRR